MLSRELVHGTLEGGTSLETHGVRGRNLDRLLRAGIASGAGGPFDDFEGAESAYFDVFPLGEGLADGLDKTFNDGGGVGLRKTAGLG